MARVVIHRRVVIETSTLCPYSSVHNQCPVHCIGTVRHLPTGVVERLFSELGAVGYANVLMLQGYNEPLAEPRLLAFLQSAQEVCPNARPYIHTSGWGLDQVLLDDLVEAGVKVIHVSAYNDSEFYRLTQLRAGATCTYNVHRVQELDARLRLYDEHMSTENGRCIEPLNTLMIRASGNVVLCCRDWAERYVFGNVAESVLAGLCGLEDRQRIAEKLAQGIVECQICAHCKMIGASS